MQPKNCIAVSLFIGQCWRITPTLSWGERCFLVHFVDRVAEHSEATLPCKKRNPGGVCSLHTIHSLPIKFPLKHNGGYFGFQYHPYCAVKWAILGGEMAEIARQNG